MIEPYLVVKWLHVLSSTVLFGTGIGTAWQMWFAHRSGDVRAIAVVSRNVVRADWVFTAPAALVQPATGAALIVQAGHDPLAPWLVASYALYAIAGVAWLIVVRLQIRMAEWAAEAAQRSTSLPPAYFRAMRWWFALGWPAFIALMAVFALMVAKPG